MHLMMRRAQHCRYPAAWVEAWQTPTGNGRVPSPSRECCKAIADHKCSHSLILVNEAERQMGAAHAVSPQRCLGLRKLYVQRALQATTSTLSP